MMIFRAFPEHILCSYLRFQGYYSLSINYPVEVDTKPVGERTEIDFLVLVKIAPKEKVYSK